MKDLPTKIVRKADIKPIYDSLEPLIAASRGELRVLLVKAQALIWEAHSAAMGRRDI